MNSFLKNKKAHSPFHFVFHLIIVILAIVLISHSIGRIELNSFLILIISSVILVTAVLGFMP